MTGKFEHGRKNLLHHHANHGLESKKCPLLNSFDRDTRFIDEIPKINPSLEAGTFVSGFLATRLKHRLRHPLQSASCRGSSRHHHHRRNRLLRYELHWMGVNLP
jgi:hypothetical protein